MLYVGKAAALSVRLAVLLILHCHNGTVYDSPVCVWLLKQLIIVYDCPVPRLLAYWYIVNTNGLTVECFWVSLGPCDPFFALAKDSCIHCQNVRTLWCLMVSRSCQRTRVIKFGFWYIFIKFKSV